MFFVVDRSEGYLCYTLYLFIRSIYKCHFIALFSAFGGLLFMSVAFT